MNRSRPPHVRARKAKGKTYYYFERYGERVRLPDISDPTFYEAYSAALRARKVVAPGQKTFATLAESYYASDRYARLAPRTKADYEKHIALLLPKIGSKSPETLTRQIVRQIQHANSARPRLANYLVTVLSILCEHAIDIGWLTHNPAKGVRSLPSKGRAMHRAWPDDVREAFEAKASPLARLVYELCIGTGQRIGDVRRMKWEHVKADAIHLRQSKTGAELVIPLTDRLRAFLATVERRGVHIAAKNLRTPYAYETIRKDIKAAGGLTIHGLRYTAISELAALGCTDDEIMSISGHTSRSMVQKYAGPARQIARARAAQEKRK